MDLFSGVGGLTIALSPWVNPIAYCEIEPFDQSALLSRMYNGELPVAPIWDDVRTLRREHLPVIDIIYGGFPYQDISESGAGVGLGGERSGLYGEVYRLAKEIKPAFLFLENVRAITSRGLDVVGEDLATLGYDCRWEVIPAYVDPAGFEGERWFCLGKAVGNRRKQSRSTIGDAPAPPVYTGKIQAQVRIQDAGVVAGEPDGLSIWTHSVRALGNAVVPHQAREAFQRLMGLP